VQNTQPSQPITKPIPKKYKQNQQWHKNLNKTMQEKLTHSETKANETKAWFVSLLHHPARLAIWLYARPNKSNRASFARSGPWNFWFGILTLFGRVWPWRLKFGLNVIFGFILAFLQDYTKVPSNYSRSDTERQNGRLRPSSVTIFVFFKVSPLPSTHYDFTKLAWAKFVVTNAVRCKL